MSDAMTVFWMAVDDVHAGREHPIEHYLSLVETAEQEQLAGLLAQMLADVGPAPAAAQRDSDDYATALKAISDVVRTAGPAGLLAGALKSMRHTRGIERDTVLDAIAGEFGITGERGRAKLRRSYHALESGRLLGSNLSHRLLAVVADVFRTDVRDLIDAAVPMRASGGAGARPALAAAMGRPSGSDLPTPLPEAEPDPRLAPDPGEQLVDALFTGGPEA
jgi:hypothetical protein